MPLSPGQVLTQRYKVVRLLGKGGFGAVYLVDDLRLTGRKVALKESFDGSPDATKQFQFEAETLARLNHPSLARVTDRFEVSGHQFLVMDFVEGEDLTDVIERGSASEKQMIEWMIQMCEAVAYLHEQKPPIIHRDIKPPNIKIRPDGRAVLVDFGIAKVYNPQKHTALAAKGASPGFSPPEQYAGGTDPSSDVYALGATLYWAITRVLPPEALDLIDGSEILRRPCQINPRVNATLEQVILKAMSLNSQARYSTAREMMQALQACSSGGALPPSVPRIRPPAQIAPVPSQSRLCPRCGRMNRPTAKFCQFDRTPLAPAAPAIAPQMRFENGNRQFRKKNYQRAVDEYQQALQSGFNHVALYYNMAGAYIELQRVDEALPVLQRGVGKYPQDAGLFALLGLAYMHGDRFAQSEQVLQRAVNLDSQNFEAPLFLSLLYRKSHKGSDAILWAKKAVQLDGTMPGGHFMLGKAYEEMSKWQEALAAFRQSAQLNSKDPDPHIHMAVCYKNLNRRREARAEVDAALAIDPNNQEAIQLRNKI